MSLCLNLLPPGRRQSRHGREGVPSSGCRQSRHNTEEEEGAPVHYRREVALREAEVVSCLCWSCLYDCLDLLLASAV